MPPSSAPSPFRSWLSRVALIEKDELDAVLWSTLYFFALLASYFILRPLREQVGIVGSIDNLKWLFTATLAGMLILQPLFSALVARYSRRTFIPAVNLFFVLNLAIFFVAFELEPPEKEIVLARVFYVWVSVFNLFVVSVFWGLMADLFSEAQGRRLFGFIAIGGTLGAIAGAYVTSKLAAPWGPNRLLLLSIALLAFTVPCVRKLARIFGDVSARAGERSPARSEGSVPVGGTLWSGVRLTFSSSYLLGIALYALLQGLSMTFLYFEQAKIVKASISDPAERTALFANIDLAVQVLTLVVQVFLTGRILAFFGLGIALVALPAMSVVGFSVLGLWPVLAVIVVFQTLMRGGNYALATPARQVLYTVVGREQKYKSKSFIDTFVYRVGDAIGAWTQDLLKESQWGIAGATLAAVPLGLVWIVNGWLLGRKQRALSGKSAGERAIGGQ